MTNDQFLALAKLMRMASGPAQEAARLVLVDGLKPADAARATKVTPQAAGQAVKRARAALKLAQTAAGAEHPA